MDLKKRFQSAPIPGEKIISLTRKNWEKPKKPFLFLRTFRFAFAALLLLILPLGYLHFKPDPSLESDGDFGAVITQFSGDSLLIAECADRDYLRDEVDYVLEATVRSVEFGSEEEGPLSSITTDLEINTYVKGAPFSEDTLQIVTFGGMEDQAIFHEGAQVRLYLVRINGELVIFCGDRGVEEISGQLSYRADEGCNMEGEEGTPVPESLHLSQVGESIQFEQMLHIPSFNPFNSGENLHIQYTRSGQNIEIREIVNSENDEESSISICSSYVWGQIDDLEKGSYELTFIVEDKDGGESRVLEVKEFELK